MSISISDRLVSDPGSRRPGGWTWLRLLVLSPELVAAAVAGFCLPVMLLIITQTFTPPIGLLLGAIGAVVAVIVAMRACESTPKNALWPTVVMLVVVVGFVFSNIHFIGQDLYPGRDGATYVVAARWLENHSTLHVNTQTGFFGTSVNLQPSSAGISVNNDGTLYFQGAHLIPALAAIGGWMGGDSLLLAVNLVIGALALLVFFGALRRFVPPWWALGAAVALGISLPWLHFARMTFTEQISLLFLFGGLSFIFAALKSARTTAFGLGGLLIGCACMARIDSLLQLITVFGVAGLILLTARTHPWRPVVALVVCAVVPTIIGVVDLAYLSAPYLRDLSGETWGMVAGIAATIVIVAAIVTVARRRPSWLAAVLRTRETTARVAAAVTALIGLGLLSRPAWMTGHGQAYPLIGGLQKQFGLPVDPTRSYAELTLNWMSWYFGWPLVILGLAGLVWMMYRCIRDRDRTLAVLLLTIATVSLLYLARPSAVPDQIWVTRRYLPVVIPGFIAAATYVVWQISRRMAPLRRGRWLAPAVAVVGALLVFVPTVQGSWPGIEIREKAPQLQEVHALCAALPKNAVVLVVDPKDLNIQQLFRSFCDVPTVGVVSLASQTELKDRAGVATAQGKVLYAVATADASGKAVPLPLAGGKQPFLTQTRVTWLEQTVDRTPAKPYTLTRTIYLGPVAADGSVTSATPNSVRLGPDNPDTWLKFLKRAIP